MPDPDFRFAELTWRAQATYVAHAYKAVAKQHHRDLLPLLRQFIGPHAVVFDVGGHAGQFAKLFAGLARDGRVYSFEPGAYARSILRLAVAAHRLGNVTIVPLALGDAPATQTLSVPLKRRGSHRYGLSHLGATADDEPVRRQSVEVTTIDRFAAEAGLARLDFIKADIEGWELRMLKGGAETIRRHRPVMMIELVDRHLARAGDTLAAAWRTLTGWDYRPHVPAGATLERVDEPRDADIFWLPGPG